MAGESIQQAPQERILVLAPIGRDATIAAGLLAEAHMQTYICPDLEALAVELAQGAALVLVTQEALLTADLHALADWVAGQPAWSDMPFIVVTQRGGGPERNPGAGRLLETLGNVTLVERPFHPFTLVSVARTALRSRRRQYDAQAQLAELARGQAALAEGEARFRTLADNIPVLTWMADQDGFIFWYNSRWYDYTGTTPAEMEGWGWQSVHDPATLPAVLQRWQGSIARQEAFDMVFPLRGADGIFRPFLTRIAPVRDEAGQVTQWFGTNVDISAERAAEAAVRESEERLRFALEAGLLGSWELETATGKFYASANFRANFGKPDDADFSYDTWLGALHDGDAERVRAAIAHAIADGVNYAGEYRVFWPDGSLHWIELRGRCVQGAQGAPRIAGVSLDITERKRIETELQSHREGLEDLVKARTADLSLALEQLRSEVSERQRTEEALRQSQKMEALGQLTGGIAHDFNNLLTGISGCLELIQVRLQQGRTGEITRYTKAASESVTRAASLTHRLLAFARRQTLELKQVNVNRLASGMEDLIRRTVGPAIEVEMVFTGGVWMTLCDANRLESALLNLCINANDAMAGSGRLTVETANVRLDDAYAASQRDVRAGQYVMLSVTDTGVGMSAEVAASAFEPFFTTKPIGQGTGLGLSMVYGFVKQSEGHVRIYSEPGTGTTIRLYLPRDLAMDDHPEPEVIEPARRDGVRNGRTVLVVEDEALIRGLIVDMLEEDGYQALEAHDGPSGLRMIESAAAVELLVTDVGLPGMNGRQFADAARALCPDLKVLFITGYAHNAAIGNRLLEENMQLMTKPFALDALSAKIRGMVEAKT
jgi:PAS domain S-box-containing protein